MKYILIAFMLLGGNCKAQNDTFSIQTLQSVLSKGRFMDDSFTINYLILKDTFTTVTILSFSPSQLQVMFDSLGNETGNTMFDAKGNEVWSIRNDTLYFGNSKLVFTGKLIYAELPDLKVYKKEVWNWER